MFVVGIRTIRDRVCKSFLGEGGTMVDVVGAAARFPQFDEAQAGVRRAMAQFGRGELIAEVIKIY